MTPDQDLINRLLDLIETLIGQKLAMVCVFEVLLPSYDWYSHVEKAEQTHAERIHELLAPLRALIVSSSGETIPETDWRRIVERLIESVNEIGPDDPDLTR